MNKEKFIKYLDNWVEFIKADTEHGDMFYQGILVACNVMRYRSEKGYFDGEEDDCVKAFKLIQSRRIDIRFVGDITGLSPEIATTDEEIEFVQNALGKIYDK